MAEDEETATARYIASNVSTQLMLSDVRDHRHDGGRSGRISLGYEDEIAGDSGYHAIGPDGRGARKEGPCLRQGDRRQSLDQPASQPVAAGAALEDEKRRMGGA
jgi:hypothetical protein